MRLAPALAVLILACSDSTGLDPRLPFVGTWKVVAVNGQAVPAPTESGDTFEGGYLTLNHFPDGSTVGSSDEYCASGQAVFTSLIWGILPDGRSTVTERNPSGAFAGPDTLALEGDVLHWHARTAEARLGTSQWELTKISDDPSAARPNACPP